MNKFHVPAKFIQSTQYLHWGMFIPKTERLSSRPVKNTKKHKKLEAMKCQKSKTMKHQKREEVNEML